MLQYIFQTRKDTKDMCRICCGHTMLTDAHFNFNVGPEHSFQSVSEMYSTRPVSPLEMSEIMRVTAEGKKIVSLSEQPEMTHDTAVVNETAGPLEKHAVLSRPMPLCANCAPRPLLCRPKLNAL